MNLVSYRTYVRKGGILSEKEYGRIPTLTLSWGAEYVNRLVSEFIGRDVDIPEGIDYDVIRLCDKIHSIGFFHHHTLDDSVELLADAFSAIPRRNPQTIRDAGVDTSRPSPEKIRLFNYTRQIQF